jgi:hypothetical protein
VIDQSLDLSPAFHSLFVLSLTCSLVSGAPVFDNTTSDADKKNVVLPHPMPVMVVCTIRKGGYHAIT